MPYDCKQINGGWNPNKKGRVKFTYLEVVDGLGVSFSLTGINA